LNDPGRQAHWQDVYKTKGEQDVSWFQEAPTISLGLIGATGVAASVIDIGGALGPRSNWLKPAATTIRRRWAPRSAFNSAGLTEKRMMPHNTCNQFKHSGAAHRSIH